MAVLFQMVNHATADNAVDILKHLDGFNIESVIA